MTPKKSLICAEIKASPKMDLNLNFVLRISVKISVKCLKRTATADFDDGCFSRLYTAFNQRIDEWNVVEE